MTSKKIILKIPREINSKSLKNPPHGKYSPNKGIKIGIPSNKIAKYYEDYRICILRPVIDRLVLRYTPAFENWTNDDIQAYKKFVYAYIDDHKQTGNWDYQYVPNDEQSHKKSWYSAYKRNVWLTHPPTGQKILIQTEPKKDNTPFFRFDFNPALLGAKGVDFFKKELWFLLGADQYGLSYESILNAPNTLYRCDVAVDILGVDVNDLDVTYYPHGNQDKAVKAMIYNSETNRTQTIYPNGIAYGSKDIYVYNKKAKYLDDHKELLYGGALHTRFEYRYTSQNKPLSDLLKISQNKTPLKKMDIQWINYEAIKDKPYDHVLFMQYARQRGLEKALELIPDGFQDEYKDTHKKAMTKIWNPQKLWMHWGDVLKASGLLTV